MDVSPQDHAAVQELLGRAPQGAFSVVVRHDDGTPRVIRNAPILGDGTPMPTLYWLVSEHDRVLVGRLESTRAVTLVQELLDADEIAAAHRRYAAERDALMPEGHVGPAPTGGVGGTRRGVKCLHAHYAWHLAGGDDPVGSWVAENLPAMHEPPFILDRSASDLAP